LGGSLQLANASDGGLRVSFMLKRALPSDIQPPTVV
jgi:hypothetical protein